MEQISLKFGVVVGKMAHAMKEKVTVTMMENVPMVFNVAQIIADQIFHLGEPLGPEGTIVALVCDNL